VISGGRGNSGTNASLTNWSRSVAGSPSSSSFLEQTPTHLYRCVRCVHSTRLFVPWLTTVSASTPLSSVLLSSAIIRSLDTGFFEYPSLSSPSDRHSRSPEQIEHIDRGVSVSPNADALSSSSPSSKSTSHDVHALVAANRSIEGYVETSIPVSTFSAFLHPPYYTQPVWFVSMTHEINQHSFPKGPRVG